MAGQLAESLFGWTGLAGAGGLAGDEQEMLDDADAEDMQAWEKEYVQQSPGLDMLPAASYLASTFLAIAFINLMPELHSRMSRLPGHALVLTPRATHTDPS